MRFRPRGGGGSSWRRSAVRRAPLLWVEANGEVVAETNAPGPHGPASQTRGVSWEFPLKLPSDVRKILETLGQRGYRAHVVGGCLRDLILGCEPVDWDVATNATPREVMELFPGNTRPTGIKHGTVTVLTESKPVEVTTYRIEDVYRDHRRPGRVWFTDDITVDLARRDFTMNAMAMDLQGNLIDPFQGVRDIENGVIRTVGDPDDRFGEDALRMLRAVRFSAQLGFRIEGRTLAAMRKNGYLIRHVSRERIGVEFLKCLTARWAMLGIQYLVISSLAETILPEFREVLCVRRMSLVRHVGKTVESLPGDEAVRLAALFICFGPNAWGRPLIDVARRCLERIRATRKTRNRVVSILGLWEGLSSEPPLPVDDAAMSGAASRFRGNTAIDLARVLRTWAMLARLRKGLMREEKGGETTRVPDPDSLLEVARKLKSVGKPKERGGDDTT